MRIEKPQSRYYFRRYILAIYLCKAQCRNTPKTRKLRIIKMQMGNVRNIRDTFHSIFSPKPIPKINGLIFCCSFSVPGLRWDLPAWTMYPRAHQVNADYKFLGESISHMFEHTKLHVRRWRLQKFCGGYGVGGWGEGGWMMEKSVREKTSRTLWIWNKTPHTKQTHL